MSPSLLRDLAQIARLDASHKNDPDKWHPYRGRASHHDEKDGEEWLFDLADEIDDLAEQEDERIASGAFHAATVRA